MRNRAMMYFDLSIPYLEAPKSDDKTLRLHRLKTLARAVELGYTAAAYDRPFKGVMSDADRCRIPTFSLASLVEAASPALPSAAALHRDLNGSPRSAPFRQYTRITVAADRMSVGSAFNAKSVLRSYDLVAAKPLDQDAFDRVCQVSDVDIIALDFPLKFRLKLPMVESAIKRGVYFEIKYSNLIADVHTRRQMLSDAKLLVDWTRGKNLIMSSSAANVSDIRGPYDVANLSSFLLGLTKERAKAAVSGNCRCLIASAMRKKDYKEAIRIERISSDEKLDPESLDLSAWKEWDPISSGEGDLPPLDDISKFFSSVSKQPKRPAIDFLSHANRFSLKDHISSAAEKQQEFGLKTTHVSCKEPVSGVSPELYASINYVPTSDRKSVTITASGFQISSCGDGKTSPTKTSKGYTCSQEPAIKVAGSNSENLGKLILNNVASDAAGIRSTKVPLEGSNSGGGNSTAQPESSFTSSPIVDETSTMSIEHVKSPDRHCVVSVSNEAPRTLTNSVDSISCSVSEHILVNGNETFLDGSVEKVVQEEQIKAKVAVKEQDEDSRAETCEQMQCVDSAQSEGKGACQLPSDEQLGGGSSDIKVLEEEVLVPSDVCMEDLILEAHNRHGDTVVDGCASSRLQSGNRRKKGTVFPVHPLRLRGSLKPAPFKKKSHHSRKHKKH